MLLLVQIDLSSADLPLFEAYEERVLALLSNYGAKLEERLRSSDGQREVHLIDFPSTEALDAFRNDQTRSAAQDMWKRCGASSVLMEVNRVS